MHGESAPAGRSLRAGTADIRVPGHSPENAMVFTQVRVVMEVSNCCNAAK